MEDIKNLLQSDADHADAEQVYVLAAGGGLYKVGLTTGPVKKRIKSLSTGAAQPLTMVACFQVPLGLGHYCERAAHLALADQAACDAGGKEFFKGSNSDELCEVVRQALQKVIDFHHQTADLLGESNTDEDLDIAVVLDDRQRACFQDLLSRRRQIDAEMQRLSLEKTLLEQEILRRFRGNVTNGSQSLLQWRYTSQRRIDLSQLRSKYPEIALALTKEYTHRRPVFLN
jgi:hypothetical protein